VGLFVYSLIVARQWLGKDAPAATKNCWRLRIEGKKAISSSQNFLFPEFSDFK
jgi:hypothetical protein